MTNANLKTIDSLKDDDSLKYLSFKDNVLHKLNTYIEQNGELEIGYVLPMALIILLVK